MNCCTRMLHDELLYKKILIHAQASKQVVGRVRRRFQLGRSQGSHWRDQWAPRNLKACKPHAYGRYSPSTWVLHCTRATSKDVVTLLIRDACLQGFFCSCQLPKRLWPRHPKILRSSPLSPSIRQPCFGVFWVTLGREPGVSSPP